MRTKPLTAAVCMTAALSTVIAFAPVALADTAGDAPVDDDDIIIALAPGTSDYAPKIKKGYTFTSGKATYKVTKLGKATQTTVDNVDGTSSVSYKFAGTVELMSYKGGKKAAVPATTSASVKAADSNGAAVTESGSFTVASIGKGAFDNSKGHKITSVSIGKNVASIGDKAFYKCKGLKKIVLKGDQIRTIGPNSDAKLNRNGKNYVKQLYQLRTKKWKACKVFEGVPRSCEIKLPNINPSKELNLKYNIKYSNAIHLLAGSAGYRGVVR